MCLRYFVRYYEVFKFGLNFKEQIDYRMGKGIRGDIFDKNVYIIKFVEI